MSEFTAEEWRTAAKVLQASWNQGGFPYSAQNAGDYCTEEATRLEAEAEYRLALAKCIAHVWHGGGWDECGPVERQRLLEAVSTTLEFLTSEGRLLPEGMGVAAWSIGPAPTAASVEFQVEKLARILADFAVADEHSGTRDDMQLARLLVARGVRVLGGAS